MVLTKEKQFVKNGIVDTYSDTYLLIKENDGIHLLPAYVYNMKTEQLFDIRSALGNAKQFQLSGNYLYYKKNLSTAEINASPLRDHWQYKNVIRQNGSGLPVGGEHMEAGRIYRLNLDTMTEELAFQMTYNGVPILLHKYYVEGNVCFINYITYLDYNNFYNQESIISASNATLRQAFLDFSNGTVSRIYVDEDLIKKE